MLGRKLFRSDANFSRQPTPSTLIFHPRSPAARRRLKTIFLSLLFATFSFSLSFVLHLYTLILAHNDMTLSVRLFPNPVKDQKPANA